MINETIENRTKQIKNKIEQAKDENDIEKINKELGYLIQSKKIEKILETEQVHNKVRELLQIPQYEQRSPEWFEQRKGKLTSSDVDSVLGNSKYACFDEILFKKCGISKPFTGNQATMHGQQYEDEAIDLYCEKYNKKRFSFGLMPHPTIDFLAGSPDDITYDGIVIEVKCPLMRRIKMGEIPAHYKAQILMNMEICDLDKGVFIEYRPAHLNEDKNYILNVVHIDRDKKWFEEIFPTLKVFWEAVQRYQEIGIENHPRYEHFLKKSQPKIKQTSTKCRIPSFISDFSTDMDTDTDEDTADKDDKDVVMSDIFVISEE